MALRSSIEFQGQSNKHFKVLLVTCYHRSVRQAELDASLKVSTKSSGTYQGILLDNTRAWLGIPYAEPPIGKLRFKPPMKSQISQTSRLIDATSQPNTCVQTFYNITGDYMGAQMWKINTPMSEDCLYLNIHAPMPAGTNLVFLFLYRNTK